MAHAASQEHDGDALKEKAVAAKEAVADLAGEVKLFAVDRFGNIKSQAGKKLNDANDTVVEFVQEHPYKSLVIAAGVGLALGLLLKRR